MWKMVLRFFRATWAGLASAFLTVALIGGNARIGAAGALLLMFGILDKFAVAEDRARTDLAGTETS